MSTTSQLVAFTTIKYGSTEVEKVRSRVFLDTAKNLKRLEIPCVALCGPCYDGYLEEVRKLHVITHHQEVEGMGTARREALRACLKQFPRREHFLWCEPEKPHLPQHAIRLWHRMRSQNAQLGLFNRVGMRSYPKEQACYYLFCRAVASKLIARDIDYAFGPMIITKITAPYFLEYVGEYGDLWDSILIPRLRIMHGGISTTILRIPFKNDPRMTDAESGSPQFVLKRIEQFNNVVPSLIAEWQKLTA